MAENLAAYPASLSVDYPQQLSRLTTFFRLFTVIPIAIILSLVSGPTYNQTAQGGFRYEYGVGGVLVVPVVLMLLFRHKYPRWWFNWNVALTAFAYRVLVYFALLRDEYPSTDEEQAVHLEIPYPNAATQLNRWLPLVKWLLAIPHYIVLFFLYLAAIVVTIVAWFAILFTGRYPEGLFDYVVGVFRWHLRVLAYMALLTTDRYPPFSLSP